MFGIVPWSQHATSFPFLFSIPSAILCAFALWVCWRGWRANDVLMIALMTTAFFVVVLFLVSQVGTGGNDRFMLVSDVYLVMALGLVPFYVENINAAVISLLPGVMVVMLLGQSTVQLASAYVVPDSQQLATVAALRARHLRVGVGNYWDAAIDDFLSSNTLDISNVNCTPGGSNPTFYNWWSNSGLFHQASHRSFYIVDNVSSDVCSVRGVEHELGRPASIIGIPGPLDEKILVYNYNIDSRISHS